MIFSVHQPSYLPWMGFFDKVDQSDVFVFLDDVQYKHREYQNRNRLRTREGWIWLTVPVQAHQGALVSEVRIDNGRDWKSAHLKSLSSCYGKAPYFSQVMAILDDELTRDWERLADLNIRLTKCLLAYCGIATPLRLSSELKISQAKTQRIVAIGKALGAQAYLSGAGGADYLDEGLFGTAGLTLSYQRFRCPVYRQQFGAEEKDFVPDLSVVDLFFNEGPRSLEIIRSGREQQGR